MAALKIALLIQQEGAAGLWAPSAEACAKLATHEINMMGGLLGRETETVIVNMGQTSRSAVEATKSAIEIEEVDAIVGMFPSYARGPVAHAVGGRVPYIYTPQFEGHERNPTVVTTGETASELLTPSITWLNNHKRVRRYFLCGSDYVWPRVSFAVAKQIIRDNGGIVTGERYAAIGKHDYDAIFDAIRSSQCDVVMPYFLGSDATHFNRAFAQAGLSGKILRFSSAIDETILYGLDENATENLFVASAYFSNLRSRNNGAFLERYHTTFGETPPPVNAFGESCYEGIHCLASLVKEAGTVRPNEVRRALGRTLQQRTARGNFASPLAGGKQPVHVARVDGYDFTVLTSN